MKNTAIALILILASFQSYGSCKDSIYKYLEVAQFKKPSEVKAMVNTLMLINEALSENQYEKVNGDHFQIIRELNEDFSDCVSHKENVFKVFKQKVIHYQY